MRANERMIFVGLAVVAVAVGFYLVLLGPKREKAGELKDQINQLNGSITSAQQEAAYGEQARQDFPKYYGRMVVLGKAVPSESDTASLLVQINSLSRQAHVALGGISLTAGGSSSATESAATTSTTPATPPSTSSSPTQAAQAAAATESTSTTASPTATTSAPATESAASTLPIGSIVGPAGLPTLPYSLKLQGSYFDIANFIGKIDSLVKPVDGGEQLSPDGRLLTLNGFSLQVAGTGPSPQLKATFAVTAYSTGQGGLTLGATPSGPAPTSPAETQVQPASAVVSK